MPIITFNNNDSNKIEYHYKFCFSQTNTKTMALSKDIIYSNWTPSKWLYKIEEVYCPSKFLEHLNGIKRQDEFFKLLEYKMVDFLSSFTEIMGGFRKRSRTVMRI